MAEYRLSGRADKDLQEISHFIAMDSPQGARKLLQAFRQHFLLLAENKNFGRARPDIRPDMRYSAVKNYLVFYRPITDGIAVVRVVHVRRNIQALIEANDL